MLDCSETMVSSPEVHLYPTASPFVMQCLMRKPMQGLPGVSNPLTNMFDNSIPANTE